MHQLLRALAAALPPGTERPTPRIWREANRLTGGNWTYGQVLHRLHRLADAGSVEELHYDGTRATYWRRPQ